MPETQQFEENSYSDEVQEIMGFIPHWIIRTSGTIFLVIFLVIIIGSYFYTFNEVVTAPVKLTTINPPAPLISKSSGRIIKWYVRDGQKVSENSVIALLDNTARFDDMYLLDSLLEMYSYSWGGQVKSYTFPEDLEVGSLQNSYFNFVKAHINLHNHINQDMIGKKITLLEEQISQLEKKYKLILRQWELRKKEFELSESMYFQDSMAYFEGGYGISKIDFNKSVQTYLNNKTSLLSFESSIKDIETNKLQLNERLLELKIKKENELNTYLSSLDEASVQLRTLLEEWFDKYVLESPINGTITFTNYWSENQVINSGERLATIVPKEETIIVARAIIQSSGLGKVEPGQKVQIKLSGFPYMEYGTLKGTIHSLSLVPEDEGYIAEIKLSEGMKSTYSENLKFIQEMDGTADIITKETRLFHKFFNPIRSVINE